MRDLEPQKLADLTLKLEHRSVVHAAGNFSECRSVALMLLQKEKGSKYGHSSLVINFLSY